MRSIVPGDTGAQKFRMLGTYYVLTGSFSVTVLSVSSVVGALIGGVLIVNEFKDAATDRVAGKRNLAVRVIDLYARLSAAK
ncbi:MAG: 1,4-dihydroxy-2-naphthoate octaprenyltransferase [Firmicutes bacterium]|nr:1,4-dihydroxy-2-naphthoate octaprenyltransferase [Bacillota bacterium]